MPKIYKRKCNQCRKYYEGVSPDFCSRKCYINSKHIYVACQMCGGVFKARKSYIKRGQMKYCSRYCKGLASRTNTSIEYKGNVYAIDKNGYYCCSYKNLKLHRVIWKEHNGKTPKGFLVHHKDNNKLSNDISNLELMKWGTHTSLHCSSKLSIEDVKRIKYKDKGSYTDIAKKYGVSIAHISAIKKGKAWKTI